MSVVASFASGIALGLGAAVPIGPVNVEIARRTLRNGFAAGALLGLGAVTIDMLYAILVVIGFGKLSGEKGLPPVITLAGGVFLLYLMVSCLRSAKREWARAGRTPADDQKPHDETLPKASRRKTGTYVTGLLMTALNPMTWAFWFVAVPATLTHTGAAGDRSLAYLAAGVALGALAWDLAFCGALSLVPQAARSPRVFAVADVVGALFLGAFGVASLVRLL